MPQRTWFKVYANKWLTGTIREDSIAVRAVFIDLLALCSDGPGADEGLIYARPGIGYTDTQMAEMTKVHRRTWLDVAKVLRDKGRIEYISATDSRQTTEQKCHVIRILKWEKYQSEYRRQKPYRTVTKGNTTERGGGEKEKEITTGSVSKNFAEFVKLYENEIGMLSPMLAQELDILSTDFTLQWFEEAVKEAVRMNKRALKYITAILERWGREGFKSPIGRKTGMPPGRPPAHRLPTTEELKTAWKK